MNQNSELLPNFAGESMHTENALHTLSPAEIHEREWLLNIIRENEQHDLLFRADIKTEVFRFARFAGTIIPAFTTGLLMRKVIRKNERLNYILQFKELLPVRNNIEKGSFAYDTLLFKQRAFGLLKNKTHLANLVCLAILFGDEFIDGIAVVHGKENIAAILRNNEINFSLQHCTAGIKTELYYEFDICTMLPAYVLKEVNEKYEINYKDFYDHLLFLLKEMNRHLNKLSPAKATQAAELICSVCNKCFDTYQTDISGFDQQYSIRHLLGYQQKKDDDIISVLLQLRAVLLDKNIKKFEPQFPGWSTMVRSMQIYDDMQDVDTDCNYQMNFVCYFAKNYFTREWNWLQENLDTLHHAQGLQKHFLVNLYMPASVALCMQYAGNIINNDLNWVQKKISSYLWKKNWFGWNNPLLEGGGDCFAATTGKEYLSISQKIQFLQEHILSLRSGLVSETMLYAHLLGIIFMDETLKESFFASVSRKEKYFLKHSLFDYPMTKKADLVKRWMLQQENGNG